MPVEFSRGHPLLCAFTFAAGYRVLGPTPWAGHIVALGIACCALLAAFGLGRAVAGRNAGLLGGITLAIQPLFVAQAAQVLPEMLLAACCTAALWAHVTSRRAAYLAFASMAMLTKETAVVLPAGLVLAEVVLAVRREGRDPGLARRLGVILLPLATLAVFLAVQRTQHGWFMFPYHTGFLATSPWAVLDRAAFFFGFAFVGQGRFVWLVVLGLVLGVRQALAPWALGRPVWVVLACYATAVFAFSIMNFPLGRYLLLVMPVLALLVASAALELRRLRPVVGSAAIAALVLVPLGFQERARFAFDEDMGYRHVVGTQQAVSAHLATTLAVDAGARIVADFPLDLGLRDPRMGYSPVAYTNVTKCTSTFDPAATYYVYASPGSLDYCRVYAEHLELVREFRSSYSVVRLYRTRQAVARVE